MQLDRLDAGPNRYERFDVGLALANPSGLAKEPNPQGSNPGETVYLLKVNPHDPIKVDTNGVGLKYDDEWFTLNSNNELTFKEAQLQTLITNIINTALSTAAVQVGAQGDIMNVTALAARMIHYDTTGTINLDGSSGEVVTDVYGSNSQS